MMPTLLYLTNSSLGPDIKLLTIPTSITPTPQLRTILFVPKIRMLYNPYLYNIDPFVEQRYGCLPYTV